MNIDQQIYKALIQAKGKQSKIVGISKPTLIGMKNGTLKTSFSKLFTVLKENGIPEIHLKSKETLMHIDAENGEINVTTKRK